MGTPDSGTFWEKHCNRAVVRAGFRVIPNWPPCFFHDKLKLFLVVYVDDFKLAGPQANMAAGWQLLRASLNLEDPAPVHLYLGCIHEAQEFAVNKTVKARAIIYNMEDYLKKHRNPILRASARTHRTSSGA